MSFPIEIHFPDMEPSKSIEQQVRDAATKLGAMASDIERCDVVLCQPHRHMLRGRRFHVRIAIAVRGETIHVNGDPGDDAAHADAHVAIRDAFVAARRRLAVHTHAHDRHGVAAQRGAP